MSDTSQQPQRLHAIVRGHVQGVNFRYYTQKRAQKLGLKGWVRNLPDGAVEVVAEGPRPALAALAEFLQHGPPSARVGEVSTDWSPAAGEMMPFDIRW